MLGHQVLGRLGHQLGHLVEAQRRAHDARHAALHLLEHLLHDLMRYFRAHRLVAQLLVEHLRQVGLHLSAHALQLLARQVVADELLQRLLVGALGGGKAVDGPRYPPYQLGREQRALEHLLVHQVLADGLAHGLGNPIALLRDDARRQRDVHPEQILRLMGPEQHADGHIVGDVADDTAYQRPH